MTRGGEFEQRRMLTTADLGDQPAAVARLRVADTLKTTNRFEDIGLAE
jgi:hypothetical protein